jgi:WD40 repeat protein
MFRKFISLIITLALLSNVLPAHADDGPITLGLGTLTSMALSPDGSRLAVGTTVGVYFYNALTFAPLGFWRVTSQPDTILWSPQGNTILLSNGYLTEVRLADSGVVVWSIKKDCYWCAWGFTPDGSRLSAITGETTAEVYNATDGVLLETVKKEGWWFLVDWRVVHLAPTGAQSADGKIVVVADDKQFKLHAFVYRATGRELLGKMALHGNGDSTDYTASRVALSPDGQLLATSEASGSVSVWMVGNLGKPLSTIQAHHGGYWSKHAFAWSPDSHTLYSAADNTVVALDATTGTQLRVLSGFNSLMGQVMWSADGQRVIAAQGDHLGAWDVASRLPVQAAFLTTDEKGSWGWTSVTDMIPSPAGDLLAAADWSGVTLHNASTLEPVRRLQTGRRIVALAFSPDGKLLATGGNSPFVNIWDVTTGKARMDLLGTPDNSFIAALAFSLDGAKLYALEGNGLLRQWNLSTGNSTSAQTPAPRVNYYYDPAIHPVARLVASERGEGGLDVSNIDTGQTAYNLKVRFPRSIVINQQGNRLAAIVGNTVKIWDLNSGSPLADYSGHTRQIADIAFSPDGSRLASSSLDGTVKIWPVP